MASYPYMSRGSVIDSAYTWHNPHHPHAKQAGEAATYDEQFSNTTRPVSVHEYPGATMRAQLAQSGPVSHPPYDATAASAPSLYPSQLQAGKQPPSYYPGQPNEQVAVGGLNRSYLAPGSYVHSNKKAAIVVCPQCRQQVLTQVKCRPGARTVVAAAAMFAVYWPLAVIPFVAKPLKRKVHMCPRCGHKIGKIVTITPA
ncbi:hypothetical protein IWW36_001656 [Coemansia brasiliensis]|uniref:LITAF domain-containing protein n=1 Tax=Coemansia brasiliensis TaxID=2650707 RepID=A0A9W8I8R3_9FUNG|nr:hypothetical protein IWW36_001656 [Coemansia brasiliensis]